MKIIGVLICTFMLLYSCTNPEKTALPQLEIEEATPDVFIDQKSSYDEFSMSKRYTSDIITQLYKEALEKDENLNILDNKIQEIRKIHDDSLRSYYKYLQTNTNYWSTVDQYIDRIQDTISRKQINDEFQVLEEDHEEKMSAHRKIIDSITQQAIVLEDQYIRLQLRITQLMMNKYQKNELPNMVQLNTVHNQYHDVIRELDKMISNKNKK